MKKQLTLLAVLTAFTLSSFGQISFDIKDSSAWALNSNFDFNLTSYLTNNTADEADSTIEWYLSGLEKPADWDVTVCSGLLCIANPTTTYKVNVPKGEKLDFKLGFSFYNVTGDGSAWVVARSVNNPSAIDSFRLQIRGGTASVHTVESKESFKAYPNPAKDFVTVDFVNGGKETVKVYDILGNLQLSQTIDSGDKIDVQNLVKGIYILRVEGNTSYSQVLHKQ